MRRTLHQGVSNAWSAPDVNLARHVLAFWRGVGEVWKQSKDTCQPSTMWTISDH